MGGVKFDLPGAEISVAYVALGNNEPRRSALGPAELHLGRPIVTDAALRRGPRKAPDGVS